jgi:hypothetical protein
LASGSGAHDSVTAVMFLWLAPSAARAADVWLGGAVSAGVEVNDDVVTVPLQAEGDVRAEWDHVYVRLDADVHLQPVDNQEVITQPYTVEWAMVQIGAGEDPYRLRLGITNPNVMLEDWDAWNNYLPTFSLMFNAASPGRLLGGEVVLHRPDGTEIFAWGGLDLDFYGYPPVSSDTVVVPTIGAGVSTEQDTFGTWTGVAWWPSDAFGGLFGCLELYHLDPVWFTIDGSVGVSGDAPFAGGSFLVNVLPEAIVSGVARFEGVIDPGDEALGGAFDGVLDGTASLGTRIQPLPELLFQLEVKALVDSGEVSPGVAALVTLYRPEPPTYTASVD